MIHFKNFRDIEQNDSITLHKLTIDDLDAIYEYSKEPDFQHAIMAQVTYTNTQIFIEMIIKEMHEGKRFYYAIKDTNKIIGTIGFLNIDLEKKESEIGFGISSNYWGTNIMSLCIHKLINDAFTIYKFQKLIVGTNKKNLRSQKFIEKNGFELEKTTQNHFYYQLQNI